MADYRVIQHVHQVMCDRLQEICDGLDLNWVGIHKDLDQEPKDDEEATIYCGLYRLDDVDEIGLPRYPIPPSQRGPQPPDPKRQEIVQIPPRFFYLYFIVFVESDQPDLANTLTGAIMNGFHQKAILMYRPRAFDLGGKLYDSVGRSLESDGVRLNPRAEDEPQEGASDGIVMEKISIALVDDLAFGDACLLLKGFERKIRPYLTYRVFAKIDMPLGIAAKAGSIGLSLFDRAPKRG